MTSQKTYDLSSGPSWGRTEIVGTYYYKESLDKLFRTRGFKDHEEGYFTADLVPEPDNPCSDGKAISVRWNDEVLGYISEGDVNDYQQVKRVVASGYRARCTARIWSHKYGDGQRSYWVRLTTVNVEQLIPLNNPPQEPWVLLPPRRSVKVLKTSENFDYLQDFIPPSGDGTLLVTLHTCEAGIKKKYIGIEVRLEGEGIGELSKVTSEKIVPIVQRWEENGNTTTAYAHIVGSSLAAEIQLKYIPASEISDEDLDPILCPLPRLVDYQADPADYDVPSAWRGQPEEDDFSAPEEPSLSESSWDSSYDDDFDENDTDDIDEELSDTFTAEVSNTGPNRQAAKPNAGLGRKAITALSWFFIFLASIVLLTAMSLSSTKAVLVQVMMAVAIAGPAIWWLYCNHKDKQLADAHSDLAVNYNLLSENDKTHLAPLGEAPRTNRRMVLVSLAAFLLFLIGIGMTPQPAPAASPSMTPTINSPALPTEQTPAVVKNSDQSRLRISDRG